MVEKGMATRGGGISLHYIHSQEENERKTDAPWPFFFLFCLDHEVVYLYSEWIFNNFVVV